MNVEILLFGLASLVGAALIILAVTRRRGPDTDRRSGPHVKTKTQTSAKPATRKK